MRYSIFTDPLNKRTKVLDNLNNSFAYSGPKNKCLAYCDASNIADSFKMEFEMTPEQLIMMKCKIKDYILENGDLSTIKMGTGLARGFQGRKPVIYTNKYYIFEAEGYPLTFIESTFIEMKFTLDFVKN